MSFISSVAEVYSTLMNNKKIQKNALHDVRCIADYVLNNGTDAKDIFLPERGEEPRKCMAFSEFSEKPIFADLIESTDPTIESFILSNGEFSVRHLRFKRVGGSVYNINVDKEGWSIFWLQYGCDTFDPENGGVGVEFMNEAVRGEGYIEAGYNWLSGKRFLNKLHSLAEELRKQKVLVI